MTLVRRFQQRAAARAIGGIVLPVEGRAHLVQGLGADRLPRRSRGSWQAGFARRGLRQDKARRRSKACGRRGQVDIDGLARRGEVEGLPSFRTLERRFRQLLFSQAAAGRKAPASW